MEGCRPRGLALYLGRRARQTPPPRQFGLGGELTHIRWGNKTFKLPPSGLAG